MGIRTEELMELGVQKKETIEQILKNAEGGGGGGGFSPVTVYAVDPLESDDTLPDAPEGTTGEWHLLGNYGISLTKGGTALKFSELIELFKESPVLILVLPGYVGDECVVQLPTFAETAYMVDEMSAITVDAYIEYNGNMYGTYGEFY